MRGISFPGVAKLPEGPQRDLSRAIYERYTAAGMPTLAKITEAANGIHGKNSDETLQSSRIAELIKGQGAPPKWAQIELLVGAIDRCGDLTSHHPAHDRRLRELWDRVGIPRQTRTPAAAAHFARGLHSWGTAHAPVRPGVAAATVSIANPSPGADQYGLVFDSSFQEDVASLQQWGPIRRGGHDFTGIEDHLPTGHRIWGPIKGRYPAFAAVESSRFGAVSVFVKDYGGPRSSDDLIVYCVLGAWRMALLVHHLLGAVGVASAAVIADIPVAGRLPRAGLRRERGPAHIEVDGVPLLDPLQRDPLYPSRTAAVPYMSRVRDDLGIGSTEEPWDFGKAYNSVPQ